MKTYIVKWSFIDKNGDNQAAGQSVSYPDQYTDYLLSKGLIIERQTKKSAPENKSENAPETKAKADKPTTKEKVKK